MRPVLLQDLLMVARAVRYVPPDGRVALCRQIFVAADLADQHRRERSRPHPKFGNGTLTAAARAWPRAPGERLQTRAFCECLHVV